MTYGNNDITMMSKKELLALDEAKHIKGRHEMTKVDLLVAIEKYREDAANAIAGEMEDQMPTETVDAVREIGVDMPAPAKKVWVNKSGNIPWRRKHYALDMDVYESAQAAGTVDQAPNQVRLILKGMAELKLTSPGRSRIGKDIIDALKQEGKLNTTIPSASLFAYYRRAMEELGVVHVKNPDVEAFNEATAAIDGEEEGEE